MRIDFYIKDVDKRKVPIFTCQDNAFIIAFIEMKKGMIQKGKQYRFNGTELYGLAGLAGRFLFEYREPPAMTDNGVKPMSTAQRIEDLRMEKEKAHQVLNFVFHKALRLERGQCVYVACV